MIAELDIYAHFDHELTGSGLLVSPEAYLQNSRQKENDAGEAVRKIGGRKLKFGRGFAALGAGITGAAGGFLAGHYTNSTPDNLTPDLAYASPLEFQTVPPCETYIRCVPFTYGGRNWKWALDGAMSPDPALAPYQRGMPAPGIVIFRQERPGSDFTYYSEFVLPNVDAATGGSLGIADVMVNTDLGKAVLTTVAEPTGGTYIPRGGYIITDLLNPRNPNNRVSITDSGLPPQVRGNWEPTRYIQRDSGLFLVRSFTDAIPTSANGDYSIQTNSSGSASLGSRWNIEQLGQIVGASRVEFNNAFPIQLGWTRGQGITEYRVVRAYQGRNEVPANATLPADITAYTELSILTSPAFYLVLSYNGSTAVDYSNLFGYIPGVSSGTRDGLRIMQDADIATLTLAPSNLDRFIVTFFGSNEIIPVPKNALSVTHDTNGRATCYVEVRIQNGVPISLSDGVCGIRLPRATAAAGR